MYEVVVNNGKLQKLTNKDLDSADLVKISDNTYHLIDSHQSFQGKVLSVNKADKTVTIELKNQVYTCSISDELDQLVTSLDFASKESVKNKDLISSMPGLVLSILVKEGQEVEVGDPLLILEAMKMENMLKATASGVIGQISVEEKAAVEKGQLLIEIT